MRLPKSGFPGVDLHNNLWRARVSIDHKRIELGCHATALDAALACFSCKPSPRLHRAIKRAWPTFGTYQNEQPICPGTYLRGGRWRARVSIDHKQVDLGYYPTALEAALACFTCKPTTKQANLITLTWPEFKPAINPPAKLTAKQIRLRIANTTTAFIFRVE